MMEESNDSTTENEEDDEEEEEMADVQETADGETEFDTNLPTLHKYLGKMNNVNGYTIYDDGELVTLIAIHTNTLVFPGFILPLVLNNIELSFMQHFPKRHNVFALVCTDETGEMFYQYGVTLEVFESYAKNRTLYMKTRCRQRCKVLLDQEIVHLEGRFKRITVQIIGEPPISSPTVCTQLVTLKRRKGVETADYTRILKQYKIRRYHLMQFPLASWVIDRNEVCFYVELMVKKLRKFYAQDAIPCDPTTLSYWVVQNYQLTHMERLRILSLNSTLERLKIELQYLQMERLMCCQMCKAVIAKQKDVFAMSKDGVQSNYCNRNGHVFETVTVLAASNFTLQGGPDTRFSWFPGYAWTIMQCQCRTHLGWKFTSRHLQPREFYGLTKVGLEMRNVAHAS